MLNLRKRIPEWITAIRWAHGEKARIPWVGMIIAVLSGPVPRDVWRERYRTCRTCVLFDGEHRACNSTHPQYRGLGCKCLVWMKALWAKPYPKGCFGRMLVDDIGWPAYHYTSFRHRIKVTIGFLFGR